MFLNTLAIGEWSVAEWATNGKKKDIVEVNLQKFNKRDEENKMKRITVEEFFDLIPKMESHYCRKKTKKKYLEQIWQSKSCLYREYKTYCQLNNKEKYTASLFTFNEIYDHKNLALFSPRKDLCDTCFAFSKKNITEEEYNLHRQRKEAARNEKDNDKANTDSSVAVFTMDMQAVLLCPLLKASALYYRTKLKVHNFTIFNLKTADAYCYLWDESEGGVNAEEFSSIICHFIQTKINLDVIKRVILFSDGCPYQNRNSVLSNSLLLTSIKTGLIIEQKYLEKGHTTMECDSMHACIERSLKNREIYSPAGYFEVCRMARVEGKPYEVEFLDFKFFKNYSALNYMKSIRPGKKKGDPVVTDIKSIKYNPEGCVKVKLDFKEKYIELSQRTKNHRKKIKLHSYIIIEFQYTHPNMCIYKN